MVTDETSDAGGLEQPFDTQLSVLCWAPRHDMRHEIVGVSRPARIGQPRFYEELHSLGWVRTPAGWRCPECVQLGAIAGG